jgi:hypothetical protein
MPKQTNIGDDKKSQGLTPDTQEAFTEYILKEFKRRREGVWFMNNGEAVYLTPEHYMVCNGTKWQIQEVIKNSVQAQAICIISPKLALLIKMYWNVFHQRSSYRIH